MKKTMKLIPSTLAALLTIGVLTGCGASGGEATLSLSVSGPATQSNWLQSTLAKFNEQRKADGKAQVNFEVLVYEENTLQTDVAKWSNGPDVFSYVGDQIAQLYRLGALASLPSATVAELKEQMGDDALDIYAKFAGRYVGYPYAADNGYFLYYDKSVLNETDVQTMSGILAKATADRKVAYDLGDPWYSMGAFFTFGADYNVTYTKAGLVSKIEATFNSDAGLKSAKMISELWAQSKADKLQFTTAAPTASNQLCATIDGSHKAAAYKKALGENYGCAKLPTYTVGDDTKTIGSFLGYKLIGVNNAKSDPDKLVLAHEVAKYLSSESVQESRFDEFNIMPTNKKVLAMEKVQNDEHVKAIAQQAATGAAHPQTAVPGKCWTAPATFTTKVSEWIDAGTTITDELLQEAIDTLNEEIKSSK